ncbi:hypothetical protein N7492_001633 [Penicillium capsulatum]|uniref:Uncharacterized protein n=1 Tax=Penicillium capsulatum TaxID=69766 RepID=A0A9W9IU65_9EURO|nr:hypothetical protein N7492_001633 [Penicillium capsulatum]
MFGVSLANPLPQGGYAVPGGPGDGKCAGSDSNREYSDILSCPAKPEAVRKICGGNYNKTKKKCLDDTPYTPFCINGNFCTGTNPGTKTIDGKQVDLVDYFNDAGCNCNG